MTLEEQNEKVAAGIKLLREAAIEKNGMIIHPKLFETVWDVVVAWEKDSGQGLCPACWPDKCECGD